MTWSLKDGHDLNKNGKEVSWWGGVAHELTPTIPASVSGRPGPLSQTKQGGTRAGWGVCLLHEASQCPWVRGDSPRVGCCLRGSSAMWRPWQAPTFGGKADSQPSVTSNCTETPGAHVVSTISHKQTSRTQKKSLQRSSGIIVAPCQKTRLTQIKGVEA